MASENPDPDKWTQGDAIALRSFLNHNPKFLRVLTDKHRPKIEGNTVEARAMTGSDAKGFFDCVDAIKVMMQDPTENPDDAGFIDGR
jgi:hypothetical protein